MNLVDYVRTLARHWWVIVVLVALGGLLGLVAARNETPLYRSTSKVLFTGEVQGTPSELVQGSAYVSNLVDSLVEVTTSELVLEPVVEELGLDSSARALARSITVENPLNTLVVDIAVSNPDPEEAQRIAAAVTDQLGLTTELISPGTADGSAVRQTTLTSASLPSAPYSPRTRLYLLAGALLGGALGVAYALMRRLLGTTVSNAEDVQALTELPLLGEIVDSKVPIARAVLSRPLGREAESLRALAANLRFLGVDKPLRSIIVTSGDKAEGKSSVCAGVALALAESSDSVLLIDGDLRAPTIAELTGLSNAIGLSDVLVGKVEMREAVQVWSMPGLDVLTSGTIPPNPAQLMGSSAMLGLLDQAIKHYDHVVIDTPPVLIVTDARWLSLHGDGVIVIARRGRTTTRSLSRTLGVLEGSPVLGMVLNRVPRGQSSPYYGRQSRAKHRSARWSRA